MYSFFDERIGWKRLFARDLVNLGDFIDFTDFTDFVELARERDFGSPRARLTIGGVAVSTGDVGAGGGAGAAGAGAAGRVASLAGTQGAGPGATCQS